MLERAASLAGEDGEDASTAMSVAAGAFCSSCSREGSWQDYKYKIKSRTLMNILFLVGGRQGGGEGEFSEGKLKWQIKRKEI